MEGSKVISINFRDPRPIYEQIKDGIRRLIVSGALPADVSYLNHFSALLSGAAKASAL